MALREGVFSPQWCQERVSEDTCPGNPLRPMKGYVPVALTSFVDVLHADPCAYCNGRGGTVDHILPRKLGGANAWTNLTGACQDCNGRKSSLTLMEFLLRKAELRQRLIRPRVLASVTKPKPLPTHKVMAPIVGKRTRRARRMSEFY